jgi:metal-dependent amidase/aminoacylase/carboxypeptidase family protein
MVSSHKQGGSMLNGAQCLYDTSVALRHEIRGHPELVFRGGRPAQLIADRLSEVDLTLRAGVAKTEVVGDLQASGSGAR